MAPVDSGELQAVFTKDLGRRSGRAIPKDRSRTGAEMSIPRSVAEVLAEHITLEVEGIDRMYLNVYVPGLQREQGVVGFFRYQRGYPFVSSAWMDPIQQGVRDSAGKVCSSGRRSPSFRFRKGQRKDDLAAAQRKQFDFDKAEEWCLSGNRKRRRRCSVPSAAGMKRPGSAIRGWCGPRPW